MFTEKSPELELIWGGMPYRKYGKGKTLVTQKVRNKGRPKMSWLRNHHLDPDSHPIDWVMALLTHYLATNNSARKTLFLTFVV